MTITAITIPVAIIGAILTLTGGLMMLLSLSERFKRSIAEFVARLHIAAESPGRGLVTIGLFMMVVAKFTNKFLH